MYRRVPLMSFEGGAVVAVAVVDTSVGCFVVVGRSGSTMVSEIVV